MQDNYYTVGGLLDFIEKYKIPRDAKIYLQRVEDVYFNERNWTVEKKEGFCYGQAARLNEKIDSGVFNDKEQYPDLVDPEKMRMSLEEMEELKDQYYRCWSPVKYKNDDNLYLDAHY